MDLEKIVLVGLLFVIAIFLYPNLETAIDSISGTEALKPLFTWFPIAFIGCFFVALFYIGGNKD